MINLAKSCVAWEPREFTTHFLMESTYLIYKPVIWYVKLTSCIKHREMATLADQLTKSFQIIICLNVVFYLLLSL